MVFLKHCFSMIDFRDFTTPGVKSLLGSADMAILLVKNLG